MCNFTSSVTIGIQFAGSNPKCGKLMIETRNSEEEYKGSNCHALRHPTMIISYVEYFVYECVCVSASTREKIDWNTRRRKIECSSVFMCGEM